MRSFARMMSVALFIIIAIVSIWTPLVHSTVAIRWFSLPNLFIFAPVPLLVVAVVWLQLLALRRTKSQLAPFLLSLLLIFLGYTGLAISMWPNVVQPSLSLWQAASPPQSMGFALVGTLFIIPVILAYTSWSYYVFRGKLVSGEGYH